MEVRVLVAEDDEGDAYLMQSLLTELREPPAGGATFSPSVSDSLPSALEALRGHTFDVVILDLDIGGARGTDALAAVLVESPQTPLVVVSSRDDVELGIRAVEMGAQDHLVKSELVGDRLARSVLYSIERQRQCEALRARTIVDELTGLYNRRGFFTLGTQTLRLTRRKGREVVVLFVDLDGLKRVNDSLGHECGDELIRAAAELLRSTFRDSDIVARIGGDEFAVVANETDGTPAEVITARLRKAIESLNVSRPADRRLSMSVGAARHTVMADAELSELLARADTEMYSDKRQHVGETSRG